LEFDSLKIGTERDQQANGKLPPSSRASANTRHSGDGYPVRSWTCDAGVRKKINARPRIKSVISTYEWFRTEFAADSHVNLPLLEVAAAVTSARNESDRIWRGFWRRRNS
jgi:hypothetical protein